MKRSVVFSLLCLVAAPALAGPTDGATAHSKAFERAVNTRDAKAIPLSRVPEKLDRRHWASSPSSRTRSRRPGACCAGDGPPYR